VIHGYGLTRALGDRVRAGARRAAVRDGGGAVSRAGGEPEGTLSVRIEPTVKVI